MMKVTRAARLTGVLQMPGDKSISHRAAMLASIAVGRTRVTGFGRIADCMSTIKCLQDLGVSIEIENDSINVEGVGLTSLQAACGDLDCGNSGTTMRLLSGILAGQNFTSVLTGDESLRTRPMKRIVDPLTAMGAAIESQAGRAPLTITGRSPLSPLDFASPTPSAQVKSCILLAGLMADGQTVVTESVKTRDHTERMLKWLGAEIQTSEEAGVHRIAVTGGQELRANDIDIPGDISSAAFLIVAAACIPGSEIILNNVGYNPSRTSFLGVLRAAGVSIEVLSTYEESGEPRADLKVTGGQIRGNAGEPYLISGALTAKVIDEIPILAVLGTQLPNGLTVRDAGDLRNKESDRIAATVDNLRRMNASVEAFDDGLSIKPSTLRGATIRTYGDHRIAMAFGVAALFADGETTIDDASCVDISFPGFFDVLNSISER